jgi:very-short-patch-repair endonuclease
MRVSEPATRAAVRRGLLTVEINGHAAHSSPWAHDRDHRKEQYLVATGYATRRFTALQAIDEPALVIAGVAAALAQKR